MNCLFLIGNWLNLNIYIFSQIDLLKSATAASILQIIRFHIITTIYETQNKWLNDDAFTFYSIQCALLSPSLPRRDTV